jgi:hypothetical protein|tara:strand:+ start:859 stop:1227 length:369 start_codon:yes stop_codon:yes gene_type:complete
MRKPMKNGLEELDNMSKEDRKKTLKDVMQSVSNKEDLINSPPHYRQAPMESIEYIKQQLGDDYHAYLLGTVYKYLHRHKYKINKVTGKPDRYNDLKKTQWYLNRLLEVVGEEETDIYCDEPF